MAYRNGNYSAFYVTEPFNPSALGAHATRDFVYYNQLRMWKGQDSAFPFNDSLMTKHTTYVTGVIGKRL